MGLDLFAFPETLVNGRYESDPEVKVFDWRHHEMWAFLGSDDSRIGIPAIAPPRGIPHGALRFEPDLAKGVFSDLDGMSWLSVEELLAFDYGKTFVGRLQITGEDGDGNIDYEPDPSAATEITFRRFLGPGFFEELDRLAGLGADRIVFFTA